MKTPLLSYDTEARLLQLAARLKARRIERGDTQAQFAARMGVSIPTLAAMERGDAKTRIGYWLEAITLLGRFDDIDRILIEQSSLFDELPTRARQRMRARPAKKAR